MRCVFLEGFTTGGIFRHPEAGTPEVCGGARLPCPGTDKYAVTCGAEPAALYLERWQSLFTHKPRARFAGVDTEAGEAAVGLRGDNSSCPHLAPLQHVKALSQGLVCRWRLRSSGEGRQTGNKGQNLVIELTHRSIIEHSQGRRPSWGVAGRLLAGTGGV